jgi:hypothetical protein
MRRLRWEWVCAAALIVIAAWLRLRHLGLAEFKSDEAIALRIAHDILAGDKRTVGLTSSSGAANPPLYVYIVAVVVSIHDSFLFATGSVAVLFVVAIGMTYIVVRRRFGDLVALITIGFFATAPWAVLYGRHLWQQDYLPLATVSLLWTLFVVLERERTRAVLLVPVLFVVAVQLNLSAVALILPIAALLVYRRRDIDWLALAGGIVVGIVLLGPWLAHNAKHGFRDFSLIVNNGRGHGGGATGTGTIEAVRQTIHLVSAEGWTFVTGPHHQGGVAWTLGRIAGIAVIALLAIGFLTSLTRLRDARRALLVVWLVGIWLSYITSSRSGVGPHYLIISYPVTFLLAALGLTDIAALLRARAAAIPVAAAIVAAFIAFSLSFQHFVQVNHGTAGDYGVIYDDTAALAKAVKAHGLDVDNAAAEYLVRGHLSAPPGAKVVATRNRLTDPSPLPCSGTKQRFGAIEACFPR